MRRDHRSGPAPGYRERPARTASTRRLRVSKAEHQRHEAAWRRAGATSWAAWARAVLEAECQRLEAVSGPLDD